LSPVFRVLFNPNVPAAGAALKTAFAAGAVAPLPVVKPWLGESIPVVSVKD
jgi:hypothetical protein